LLHIHRMVYMDDDVEAFALGDDEPEEEESEEEMF
jgi:hypothetical protein